MGTAVEARCVMLFCGEPPAAVLLGGTRPGHRPLQAQAHSRRPSRERESLMDRSYLLPAIEPITRSGMPTGQGACLSRSSTDSFGAEKHIHCAQYECTVCTFQDAAAAQPAAQQLMLQPQVFVPIQSFSSPPPSCGGTRRSPHAMLLASFLVGWGVRRSSPIPLHPTMAAACGCSAPCLRAWAGSMPATSCGTSVPAVVDIL